MKNIKSFQHMIQEERAVFTGELSRRLLRAIENSNLAEARAAIDAGADVNWKPALAGYNEDYTLLHCCASWGFRDEAKLLVESGADVNARDEFGQTPLHISATRGFYFITELLLDAGAEPDAESNSGSTPARNAVKMGYVGLVQSLIERGADPLKAFEDPQKIIEFFKGKGDIDWMPEGPLKTKLKRMQREEDLFGSDF